MALFSRKKDSAPAMDPVLREAKDRFKRCQNWETDFRRLYVEDVKFANGDSDNGWQWPDDLRRDREKNKRPALTINKVARHVALITNDARQNKPSISIKPTNNEASFASAQVFEGLVRDIEYKSHAQDTYDDATDSQVEGGIGYWRVLTEYETPETFDQVIRIAPVRNHLSVYLDPDIKQKDGSDAEFGFVFDEMPREEFELEHPDVDATASPLGLLDDWVRPDYVRVAEYYRIRKVKDELYWMEDDQGKSTTFLASKAPKGFKEQLVPGKFKKRSVETRQLEWFKIAGHQIIEERLDLKGNYIPLVRVVGVEKVIAGKLERKGFVRALKDPQRMYNYNSSGQVEFGALQTKSPYVGAAAAFEGNEAAWNNANRDNAAYLTFNHLDSEGNPLPGEALPRRSEPPATAPAMLAGMQIADAEMEGISGQFAAQQGMPSNEKSGKAIQERQRQSDIATYLFVNNLAIAIRYTGRIIIDLVPHIYDTQRVLQILGKDGVQQQVTVDPALADAYSSTTEGDVEKVLFNPAVGKYEVQAEVGPAYSTQRQEAYNAFVQIISSAPDLIGKIGDLMFRSADFPLADKIAERLRRDIEANAPYLLKDGMPTPQVQQLTAQLQAAQGQVADLMETLAEKNLELKDKSEDHRIRDYEAESKRLTAETNAIVDMKKMQIELGELMQTIMQTLGEMQGSGASGPNGVPPPPMEQIPNSVANNPVDDDGNPAIGSASEQGGNPNGEEEAPPVEGAEKDEDGNWYATVNGQRHVVVPTGAEGEDA